MKTFDIAIVGAGFVGTPLAHVLAQQGWSVALLDAASSSDKPASAYPEGLTQRCTALSLGTAQWLQAQGLWADVAQDACPIAQVHVSHKGYFGATRLNAQELDAEAVGYVVSNNRFNTALLQQLKHSAVRYLPNVRVSSVSYGDGKVDVHFEQATITARLLIAADGVSSIVRESAGIDTTHVDYEQSALLGAVQLQGQHNNVAYERFTSSGPLALLPRSGSYMSFVDCIEPHERETLAAMSDQRYLQRLQKRFGFRLGRFNSVGPRFATPLMRIEASRQTGVRTVLLGSAMRLLHPVGGQGYNLAMRDVAQLCEQLRECGDADPGSTTLLDQFVSSRRQDQERVVQFTDLLARGFRGSASLPAHVRALGLISLDTLSPLRDRFARRTMGMA